MVVEICLFYLIDAAAGVTLTLVEDNIDGLKVEDGEEDNVVFAGFGAGFHGGAAGSAEGSDKDGFAAYTSCNRYRVFIRESMDPNMEAPVQQSVDAGVL